MAGVAMGAQLDASSRPAEGAQEQLVPPEPVSGVETPAHAMIWALVKGVEASWGT